MGGNRPTLETGAIGAGGSPGCPCIRWCSGWHRCWHIWSWHTRHWHSRCHWSSSAETPSPRFTSSWRSNPCESRKCQRHLSKTNSQLHQMQATKTISPRRHFFPRPTPHSSRQVVHHAFGWLFLLCSFCSFHRHRDGSLDCVLVLCQIVFCCPSSARFITSLR